MSWLDKLAPPMSGAAPAATPPTAAAPQEVSATSPARLLAKSLTDPETRGEWTRSCDVPALTMGGSTKYRNAQRDITLTSWWSAYGGGGVQTPFTLTKAEEKIVSEALAEFGRHLSMEAQQAALARLVAPRKGLQRDSGETVKQGSTRRAKARSSKTMRPTTTAILPNKERPR